jgi:hypothetical protein
VVVSQVSNVADMSIPDWIRGGTPITPNPTSGLTITSKNEDLLSCHIYIGVHNNGILNAAKLSTSWCLNLLQQSYMSRRFDCKMTSTTHLELC